MIIAIVVILLFLILALYLGVLARKGKAMDLDQWSVGGRKFGWLFVFLLIAGEANTTFTLLGGSGWAYGKGGPAAYMIIYLPLATLLTYFIFPTIWKYAKKHRLISQPDYFASKFNSKKLGILTAVVGVISMFPYFILQLKGLGIIVSVTSYGLISPNIAIWIGAVSLAVYVTISGINGSAWTAALKDILIFIVVLFLGIYLPIHYYGDIQSMFELINQENAGFLVLPESGLSISWFISATILSAIGGLAWPHLFNAVFSSNSARDIRKSTIMRPLYSLMILFAFFVGFTAILQLPGLEGTEIDTALLKLSLQTFDPWIVGIIGAAGLLTALVPGSILLVSICTSLSKNIYATLLPKATNSSITSLAKLLVPFISLIAAIITIYGDNGIVKILLIGYGFAAQLVPSIILSLPRKNIVNKYGAASGMVVGVLIVSYTTITNATVGTFFPTSPQFIQDLDVGIIALIMNVVVCFLISQITRVSISKGNDYKLSKKA